MAIKRATATGEFKCQDRDTLQVTTWSEKRVAVTTSGASQLLVLPTDSELVEITAQENVYINFGDNTVVATSTIADDESRFFLAGVQVIPVPVNATHVAVIQESAAGIFQVEKVN